MHHSHEVKQAENKEAKLRNLANAQNTSLLFHKIPSPENRWSIERKPGDMQRARGKKKINTKLIVLGACKKNYCLP